jgi:hypothetical protein
MKVQLRNFPSTLTRDQALLEFPASGNVSASTLDQNRGELHFEIPTQPDGEAGAVELRLFLNSANAQASDVYSFPSSFTYMAQPQAQIVSILPSAAPVFSSQVSRITVSNIPGTTNINQVGVLAMWTNSREEALIVTGVTRIATDREEYSVQTIALDVQTPVDLVPDDEISLEGPVSLRVMHLAFEGIFAQRQAALTLFDASRPQVETSHGWSLPQFFFLVTSEATSEAC